MSNIAISVENLSKSYRLGQIGTGTFVNDLKIWWARTRGKPNPLLKIGESNQGNRDGEDVWALKDVNFTVGQGEVLGIIGRNGAGKSTLLKILSRITAPTSGQVKVRGRIASLLEVGTGFHPELTGRENIYLNGAILGMDRAEIARKFDEIVDFSGVEKFIDTPVKRYSSGMYVRLAFAVAAHLEPEILLVDEVLAVGDAEFQRKCLGKMGEVAQEGRTVLFVSHNMTAVESLCAQSILIENGSIVAIHKTSEVIKKYLSQRINFSKPSFDLSLPQDQSFVGRYTNIILLDVEKRPLQSVSMGDDFIIGLEFEIRNPIRNPAFSVRLFNRFDQDLVAWRSSETYGQLPATTFGGSVYLTVKSLNLLPGTYHLAVALSDSYQTIDYIENALTFDITPKSIYATGKLPRSNRAIIFTYCDWDVHYK